MADLAVELLVLCEKVSVDDQGRPVLERAFGRVVKDSFPAEQSIELYAEVWGAPFATPRVHGRIEGPRGDIVAEHSPDGVGLDEDGVTFFALTLESVRLPEAGVYCAYLLADGHVLARRRFRVDLAPAKSVGTGTL